MSYPSLYFLEYNDGRNNNVRSNCFRLVGLLIWASLCPSMAAAERVVVFAAASLREAMTVVARHYEREAGVAVVESYAGSSTLARQIERGAPAAIFISADLEWMDYLEHRKLLKADSRRNLLRNELVLIAPARSTVSLAIVPGFPLAAALGDSRLAMANPNHVPAGKYAKAALESLGVWSSVAGRIARGENVRTALNFVSRGEAPLGVVYRTDAAADKKVRIVGVFPAASHPPVVYPIALLRENANQAAEAFFLFLESPAAMRVFQQHGFVPY